MRASQNSQSVIGPDKMHLAFQFLTGREEELGEI